jgi:hypothetical protein
MMRSKNIPWVHGLILFAMLTAYPLQVYAATVRISWNPNTEPTVVGYMVYYGTESRSYTQALDAENSTTIEIGDLEEDTRYYFAVTAYTVTAYNEKVESEYSKEVDVCLGNDCGAGGGGGGGGGGCFIATAAL